MSWWTSWLSAEVDATIVALLLIAAARVFPRMPATWRVGLTTVALLKLALPIVPGLSLVPLPGLAIDSIARLSASEWAPNVTVLAFIHLLGAAALLALLRARARAVVRSLTRATVLCSSRELAQRFHFLAARLGVRHASLRLSPSDVGPLACGIVRPIVVVPARLVGSLAADELDAVLLHELTHHARRDLWLRLAGSIVACLCWVNPVAWLLARQLRRATEEAADDAALAHMDRDVARYCAALVRSARFAASPAAAPAAGLHPLGHRLMRLSARGASTPTLGVAGWMLCVSVGFLAMSAQFVHNPANRVEDGRIVIRDRIVVR